MDRVIRVSGWALAAAIAVIWCVAGVGKIVDLLWALPDTTTKWVDHFPPVILFAASLLQIVTAVLIVGGRATRGLLAGLALCVALAIAAFFVPFEQSSSCGCAGSVPIGPLAALSPLDHAIALSAMHVFALACLACRNRFSHRLSAVRVAT
jgi:uncharacterized membrane protein YphA (DoxX/SURF4 family)